MYDYTGRFDLAVFRIGLYSSEMSKSIFDTIASTHTKLNIGTKLLVLKLYLCIEFDLTIPLISNKNKNYGFYEYVHKYFISDKKTKCYDVFCIPP